MRQDEKDKRDGRSQPRAAEERLQTEHAGTIRLETHFLVELAQRRFLRFLAFVQSAAGQCPLAWMIAKVRRSTGQHQRRAGARDTVLGHAGQVRPPGLVNQSQRHRGPS